jgi:integrase
VLKTINRIRATEYSKLLRTEGKHNDGGSLYLVVRGGSARWEYQFKRGGQVASKWLGSAVGYAPMSLAQAREARVKVWLDNRGKEQPHNRAARVTGKPFTEVLEAWLAANPDAWAEKSVAARRGLAKLSFATKDVAKITQADVLAALANETPRMHAEKRGWLAALFSYAKAQQWRTGDNPCDFEKDLRKGFAQVPDGESHAALAPADLPAAFKALPDTDAGRAVQFQILTAARPGAVEAATWSQIVENGTMAWEYTILKGNKPFLQRVPLSKATLEIIGERGAADARLFKLVSNAMLNTFQKVAPGMSVHATARATFKQWCDDTAVEDTLSEAALGHYRGDKVHRAYSRGDLFDRRRTLMDSWSKFCAV